MKMTTTARNKLGAGLYSLAELRRYLAWHGSESDALRAPYWLRAGLNPVDREPGRPDYSFADLISLFVVRELGRHGVRLRDIREAEAHLRKLWKTDRPFVSGRIRTDGRCVLVDEDVIAPGQGEAAERGGQQVMVGTIADHLKDVRYRDQEAKLWTPAKGIIVDPEVQFGEPVIEGTRLTTKMVAEFADAWDEKSAARRFDLDPDLVKAAVSFERRSRAGDN